MEKKDNDFLKWVSPKLKNLFFEELQKRVDEVDSLLDKEFTPDNRTVISNSIKSINAFSDSYNKFIDSITGKEKTSIPEDEVKSPMPNKGSNLILIDGFIHGSYPNGDKFEAIEVTLNNKYSIEQFLSKNGLDYGWSRSDSNLFYVYDYKTCGKLVDDTFNEVDKLAITYDDGEYLEYDMARDRFMRAGDDIKRIIETIRNHESSK